MNKSNSTAPPTPPPPQYLPKPPFHWLKELEKNDIIFCRECENIYYVYDEKKKCIRQFRYECECDLN